MLSTQQDTTVARCGVPKDCRSGCKRLTSVSERAKTDAVVVDR